MKYIQDPQIGDTWITIIPKIETKNNKISNVILERRPFKIEKNQLVKKIGKLSKYDTYIYINELMSFMNRDISHRYEETLS